MLKAPEKVARRKSGRPHRLSLLLTSRPATQIVDARQSKNETEAAYAEAVSRVVARRSFTMGQLEPGKTMLDSPPKPERRTTMGSIAGLLERPSISMSDLRNPIVKVRRNSFGGEVGGGEKKSDGKSGTAISRRHSATGRSHRLGLLLHRSHAENGGSVRRVSEAKSETSEQSTVQKTIGEIWRQFFSTTKKSNLESDGVVSEFEVASPSRGRTRRHTLSTPAEQDGTKVDESFLRELGKIAASRK